jgi:hypothetical protein
MEGWGLLDGVCVCQGAVGGYLCINVGLLVWWVGMWMWCGMYTGEEFVLERRGLVVLAWLGCIM